MDQKSLRVWEAKCIQEEPPCCQGACPLHLDARALCKALAQGKIDAAWAVACRTLPLPGIIARICDAPCKQACLRSDIGGGIEMDHLERFLALASSRTPPVRPLPSRGKTTAIVGAELAGLSAAWDLAKKGYTVTVIAQKTGAALLDRHGSQLSDEILDKEITALSRMGVTMRLQTALEPGMMEELLSQHDAVFVDPEALTPAALEVGSPDALTLGTTRTGLFAADLPAEKPESPALLAALGRRAANSIERFTQGASLVAGREREAPFESKLHTNITDIAPVPTVPAPPQGYDEDQAKAEASRCLQCECMECVRHCAYLEHYKSYPKVYARQFYNNASIVMGTRGANTQINSCMLCGLCETLCPEDFSMADLCLEARRDLVRNNHMPASAHEFALRDMAFADGPDCALSQHAPDTDSSEFVFFPGCQLTASNPESVERAYAHLRQAFSARTGLILRCCAAPAHWAGREALFDAALQSLREDWQHLGSPTIITACPTCAATLREHLPEATVQTLWETLSNTALPTGATTPSAPLAVHDPCATRDDASQRQALRDLLHSLGTTTVELELSGEYTQCCGFGGLLSEANPSLAVTVAQRRGQTATEDFATSCAMCRDMLAGQGKRTLHLLDLLFPGDDPDPAARSAPGYSLRRENRVRLKERLLSTLWNTPSAPRPAYESLALSYTYQARQQMQDRRILTTDLQKTIANAEASGTRLVNSETGRFLASLRPNVVTYWVEYEPDNAGGFRVHSTWSHRMKILGGPQ